MNLPKIPTQVQVATCLLAVFVCGPALLLPGSAAGLFRNTLSLTAAVVGLSLPLAWIVAAGAQQTRRGQTFDVAMLILLFCPLFLQLAGWEAGFGRGGWYSTMIRQRLTDPPLEGLRGAVWVHAVAAIPWLYWILRLGLRTIPRQFVEAAMLDASRWQVFWRITLPLALPVFLVAVMYVVIICATEITVTDRYQVRTYAEVLYSEFVLVNDFATLPLSTLPVVMVMTAVLVCGLWACHQFVPRLVHVTPDRHTRVCDERSAWLTWLAAAIVAALLLIPLANLVYQAGIEVVQQGDQRVRSWSAEKLFRLVAGSPMTYRSELAWSAILAQASVATCLASSLLLGWWARTKPARQAVCAVAAVCCYVTPGPFVSLGIIWLLSRPNQLCMWLYNDTIFAPWLAICTRVFPITMLVIWHAYQRLPQACLDAAASDGASRWQVWRMIAWPQVWPHVVYAAVVGLALSMGELSASILVLPPGVMTLSSRVFNLIHYGAEDELAGLCLAMIVWTLLIVVAARWAWLRANAGSEPA